MGITNVIHPFLETLREKGTKLSVGQMIVSVTPSFLRKATESKAVPADATCCTVSFLHENCSPCWVGRFTRLGPCYIVCIVRHLPYDVRTDRPRPKVTTGVVSIRGSIGSVNCF